jgi:RecA/RadA recombinase
MKVTTNPTNHFGNQRNVATIKRFPSSCEQFILVVYIEKLMPNVLPTGSNAIDNLLGGGIHYGMVTDIYGESGTGKSQLCFTICARSAQYFENSMQVGVVFIDTGGTFRPERIREIAEIGKTKNDILENILVVRSFSSTDQVNTINRLANINPRLLIIDGVASLFTIEYRSAARHLALMKHLHELSLAAIKLRCAILITNMVRTIATARIQEKSSEIATKNPDRPKRQQSDQQRELMGTSVSIYAHMKLALKAVNPDKSVFKAALLQPSRKQEAYYTITRNGVTDLL